MDTLNPYNSATDWDIGTNEKQISMARFPPSFERVLTTVCTRIFYTSKLNIWTCFRRSIWNEELNLHDWFWIYLRVKRTKHENTRNLPERMVLVYFCHMDRDETLEVKSRLCTMATVPFRSHAENWCRYRRIDIAGRQKLLKVQWLLHLISVAREVGYFHIFLALFPSPQARTFDISPIRDIFVPLLLYSQFFFHARAERNEQFFDNPLKKMRNLNALFLNSWFGSILLISFQNFQNLERIHV